MCTKGLAHAESTRRNVYIQTFKFSMNYEEKQMKFSVTNKLNVERTDQVFVKNIESICQTIACIRSDYYSNLLDFIFLSHQFSEKSKTIKVECVLTQSQLFSNPLTHSFVDICNNIYSKV